MGPDRAGDSGPGETVGSMPHGEPKVEPGDGEARRGVLSNTPMSASGTLPMKRHA